MPRRNTSVLPDPVTPNSSSGAGSRASTARSRRSTARRLRGRQLRARPQSPPAAGRRRATSISPRDLQPSQHVGSRTRRGPDGGRAAAARPRGRPAPPPGAPRAARPAPRASPRACAAVPWSAAAPARARGPVSRRSAPRAPAPARPGRRAIRRPVSRTSFSTRSPPSAGPTTTPRTVRGPSGASTIAPTAQRLGGQVVERACERPGLDEGDDGDRGHEQRTVAGTVSR